MIISRPIALTIFCLLNFTAIFSQNEAIVLELEDAQLGSSFSKMSDGNTQFVSINGNGTGDVPLDETRVISLQVNFASMGEYDLYLRCRVGPNPANDDSFFYGNGFGSQALTSGDNWIRANGLATVGYTGINEIVDGSGSAGSGVWKWINLSEFTGDEPPIKFTVGTDGASLVFQIGAREDGFDMDKIAFGKSDLFYSVKNLDNGESGRNTDGPDYKPIAEGKGKFLGNVHSNSQTKWFENYWNQVTPENGGKWGSVEAQRDVMNWTSLDAAYKLAKDNGFPFKLHVLIWGSQQPSWIENLPPAEQKEEIIEWYQAVANRYPDIDIVEVVNEPINAPPFGAGKGNYGNALGGNGSTGWDWIIEAFRLARQYFPNSILMFNEYSVVNSDTRANQMVQIANLLKAQGYVDAIGVQAHAFSTRGSTDQMKNNLDKLAATGLDLYVTELDIDGSTDDIQLNEYKRLFPVFWEHPAVKGITLWGWRTGLWRQEQKAYIMGEDGITERPALVWLREYIAQFPTSNQEITKTADEITIFPNPVTGSSVFVSGLTDQPAIDFFNQSGQLILQSKVVNSAIELPTNLASGTYFIRIRNKDNIWVKKLSLIR